MNNANKLFLDNNYVNWINQINKETPNTIKAGSSVSLFDFKHQIIVRNIGIEKLKR